MAPRAVLFDLDDTLYDHLHSMRMSIAGLVSRFEALRELPAGMVEATYRDALEELHVHVLAGTMTIPQARQARVRRILELAIPGPTASLVDEGVRVQKASYEGSRQAVPGARALLEALRGQVRIGVVTNNMRDEQVEKLRICGLTEYVDELVTSEEVGRPKPGTAMFRVALERLGIGAQESVMVGDSWTSDIAGAVRAGIRPVWLNREDAPAKPRYDGVEVAEIRSLDPHEPVVRMLLGGA